MRLVGWAFFYMMVVLKIPVLAALWIVWWSIRSEPTPADEERIDGGGGGGHHPRPRRPGPSRRGPHAGPPPRSPGRVRAKARLAEPAHR
jgi:hypothetical protein